VTAESTASALPPASALSPALSPVRTGAPVGQAASDGARPQALLDADAALGRAQARLGPVRCEAAAVVSRADRPGPWARRPHGAANPVGRAPAHRRDRPAPKAD